MDKSHLCDCHLDSDRKCSKLIHMCVGGVVGLGGCGGVGCKSRLSKIDHKVRTNEKGSLLPQPAKVPDEPRV